MKKKILIVDDAMFMRNMVRKILEGDGYTDVIEAKDGEEALKLYKEESPDLVILDITMPGKTGVQVLEEIIAADSDAKVIMCSAMGQEKMIQRAVELGAYEFVVKPFKPEQLSKAVKKGLMS